MLHRNGARNVYTQASIVNLFIPEGMLEPIPAVINWKAAVHLGRVSSLDCGRELKRSGKKKSKEVDGGRVGVHTERPQVRNCPISIHCCATIKAEIIFI